MERNNDNNGVIYGKNAVLEFLKSGRKVDTLYISADETEKQAGYYTALAKDAGAVVKRIPQNKLFNICGSNHHQGIAALCSIVDYCQTQDILDIAANRGEAPFIIMTDGMSDPHNLGAVIRTAAAAGAHGVIIPKRGAAGVTPTVHHVSAGAVNHIAIARVTNLSASVRELKKIGIFCFAADMSGQSAYETDMRGPVLLIIGSEGFGVSRLLKELSDFSVSLPMTSGAGSLNASVAAGALIYEIVRQRSIK